MWPSGPTNGEAGLLNLAPFHAWSVRSPMRKKRSAENSQADPSRPATIALSKSVVGFRAGRSGQVTLPVAHDPQDSRLDVLGHKVHPRQ